MKLNDLPKGTVKAAAAAGRYRLLRTAQSVLNVKGADWKEQHRTVWCSRSLKYFDETVGVFQNASKDGATLTGLNRCGCVHTCPVCAAKIGEHRRKELNAGMVAHVKNGGTAYLFTYTFPHDRDMPLTDLLEKFDKARNGFQNSKKWKSLKKANKTIGVVNSLEFTVSLENGWHPHLHMLVFCDKQGFGHDEKIVSTHGDLDSRLIRELKKLWVERLFKAGLGDQSKITDMMEHALNVRGGEKAAEYIAKFGRDEHWGASSEMTRGHAKVGGAGQKWGLQHFTPFQLLVWAEAGDGWAIHRFREYAEAVAGKRALTWSPGLKKSLGIDDLTDEELSENDTPRPDQVKIGVLTGKQYAVLLSRRQVPEFIEYAGTCAVGQDCIDEFVEAVRTIPRQASGAILLKNRFGGGKTVAHALGIVGE